MSIYVGLLSVMWAGLVFGVPRWGEGFTLRRPRQSTASSPTMRVSVCIPARNEAHNIHEAVAAVLASRWRNLELIVVDDRSTDGTAQACIEAGAGDPRLRVLSGDKPPEQWAGKPWACLQAAKLATGEVLVFVDADVRIDSMTVQAVVETIQGDQLDFVSLFGSWRLVSFWERVVIPTVGWLIRGAVDLNRANDPESSDAFANGQLIAMRRGPYMQMGGHAAVFNQVLEDVRLAQIVKSGGYRVGLFVAPWAFSVRLYRGLSEIISGYAKNLYEGMGRRLFVGLLAIGFIGVGTLLPYVLVIAGTSLSIASPSGDFGPWWLAPMIAVCIAQWLFRFLLERRDGRSGWIAWAHPLGNLVLVVILIRSVFSSSVKWKGRRFKAGQAGYTT